MVDNHPLDGGTGVVMVGADPIPFVHGDFTTPETLLRAGVNRASAIWFCSGAPTANLAGAHLATTLPAVPERCRIVPLVDDDLAHDVQTRSVAELIADVVRPRFHRQRLGAKET